MARPSNISNSFTCFPKLAGELRNMVWREALPNEPTPALVPFRSGCWTVKDREPDLVMQFDHSKLGPVRFCMPLLVVSREARGVAKEWMQKQGIAIRSLKKDPSLCLRPFDPTLDALLIEPGHWDDFHEEAVHRSFEPDMLNRTFSTDSRIRHLAMRETLVESMMGEIPALASDFEQKLDLFVLVDSPPEQECANQREEGAPHLGFALAGGVAFFWNRDRRCFEAGAEVEGVSSGGASHSGDARLSALVEASQAVVRQARGPEVRTSLSLRPAIAYHK